MPPGNPYEPTWEEDPVHDHDEDPELLFQLAMREADSQAALDAGLAGTYPQYTTYGADLPQFIYPWKPYSQTPQYNTALSVMICVCGLLNISLNWSFDSHCSILNFAPLIS